MGEDNTHSYITFIMVNELERQHLKVKQPGFQAQDLLPTGELLYPWASDHLLVEKIRFYVFIFFSGWVTESPMLCLCWGGREQAREPNVPG